MPAHVQLLTSNSISASLCWEKTIPIFQNGWLKKKQPKSQGPLAPTVLVRLLGIPMVPSTFHAATWIVVESKKRNAQPIHTYLRYVSMCVKWLKEKKDSPGRWTTRSGLTICQHLPTQTMHYIFGKSLKITSNICIMFDPPPPKRVPLNDPVSWNLTRWWSICNHHLFESNRNRWLASVSNSKVAGHQWQLYNKNKNNNSYSKWWYIQLMWLINLIVITLQQISIET